MPGHLVVDEKGEDFVNDGSELGFTGGVSELLNLRDRGGRVVQVHRVQRRYQQVMHQRARRWRSFALTARRCLFRTPIAVPHSGVHVAHVTAWCRKRPGRTAWHAATSGRRFRHCVIRLGSEREPT
jgi:hypothetical protein